jgi:hypothetical protein
MDDKNDLNFVLQKAIKSMYVDILNVCEDVFINEIGADKERWDRVRSRIFDIGNNTARRVGVVVNCCDVKPKMTRQTFVNVDGKLVKVQNGTAITRETKDGK